MVTDNNVTNSLKLIGPFKQLLGMDTIPLRGPVADIDLCPVTDAGIVVKGDTIIATGKFDILYKEYSPAGIEVENIQGNRVAMPGFIDAHTHICFAGNRIADYAMRNAGKTYLEIAEAGGGIWSTVKECRNASRQELALLTAARANKMLHQGVTTIEVKSGYGLSVTEELKMLYAINDAQNNSPASLIPTCLAAHMLPRDFNGNKTEYLDEISEKLLPVLKEKTLCNRVDAFVEQSAFSVQEITPYLLRAGEMGFAVTIHADQFTTSGSELAVYLNAVSADHLEASTEKEISALAKSQVIPVVLPGASMGLGMHYAPARKILDAGSSLVIASDFNPGSAPMGLLLLQACVMGAAQKLTNAEVFAAITCRAAHALQLPDRGQLSAGKKADIIAFDTTDYREITWHQGSMLPQLIWKNAIKIN